MFQPNIFEVKSVKWPEDDNDRVTFEIEGNSFGSHWAGSRRKDFWRRAPGEPEWEEVITPGTLIKTWETTNSVVGLQVFVEDDWENVWCASNNFRTRAEEKKGKEDYNNFILDEGKRIADMIDAGKSYDEINSSCDEKGHSGNTHAHSLAYGIAHAKNEENALEVKRAHNKFYGRENTDGVVNPAVMTLGK